MAVEIPAGGLTSALNDVLKITGGTWVAWGSGTEDKAFVDNRSCIGVPPENPVYKLKRVWLCKSTVEDYYHGYANQVLWPLCHISLDRVYFRRKFWAAYKRANRIFAESVIEEADDDHEIWIHDYHLCLLPAYLRESRPDLTIAHFWHIPWPDWSVFRICPQTREILEGLLGNDLIGFQLPLFVNNFMQCAKEILKAEIDYRNSSILYKGHITRLEAFPISVDYKKFSTMARTARTERMVMRLRRKYSLGDCLIGIGADRLEYTKALIKRLHAIDLFLGHYERFRRKFVFIQIAAATRTREPYAAYQKAVGSFVRRINEKYGTHDWRPVIYIETKLEHKDLVAYYLLADIAIISSIYDGMNLVAKEYVASQIDNCGVLILSELAGAAEELEGALLVNPYDVECFADRIHDALVMPDLEKRSRMKVLRSHVEEHDVYKWIQDILDHIAEISSIKSERKRYLFDALDQVSLKNLFLFLDYDGTLTPIAETPEEAFLSSGLRTILAELKQHMPIAIITGRKLEEIKRLVGIDDLVYAGNHGAEIWDGTKRACRQPMEDRSLLAEVVVHLVKALNRFDGAFVEDKGITATVHFRKLKSRDMGDFLNAFWRTMEKYKQAVKIASGRKVLEIRPLGLWHKGHAVLWILEHLGKGRYPVYIGDDITDEDAFREIKGKGISISVGRGLGADFYLKSQNETKRFLEWVRDQVGEEAKR